MHPGPGWGARRDSEIGLAAGVAEGAQLCPWARCGQPEPLRAPWHSDRRRQHFCGRDALRCRLPLPRVVFAALLPTKNGTPLGWAPLIGVAPAGPSGAAGASGRRCVASVDGQDVAAAHAAGPPPPTEKGKQLTVVEWPGGELRHRPLPRCAVGPLVYQTDCSRWGRQYVRGGEDGVRQMASASVDPSPSSSTVAAACPCPLRARALSSPASSSPPQNDARLRGPRPP